MFVVRSVLICLFLMVTWIETSSCPETFFASLGMRMVRVTVSSLLESMDRSMGSSRMELSPSSVVASPESVTAVMSASYSTSVAAFAPPPSVNCTSIGTTLYLTIFIVISTASMLMVSCELST